MPTVMDMKNAANLKRIADALEKIVKIMGTAVSIDVMADVPANTESGNAEEAM